MKEKLFGLDLFSGIGGISLALQEWVSPIAYCENDRYAQRILLSRMFERKLPIAPIWDDIRTLRGELLPIKPNIIYGGFPCTDISYANSSGKGLEGKRSGLFFEILRLSNELKPSYLFLENVPGIKKRGLDKILEEITRSGYDCRWCMLSAREVGACHRRNRWFLLGRNITENEKNSQSTYPMCDRLHNSKTNYARKECQIQPTNKQNSNSWQMGYDVVEQKSKSTPRINSEHWWAIEPNLDRVVDGLPYQMDRIKSLGNAVVPLQAKEAFKRLMGIK